MHCPHCQTENPDTSRFCMQCGAPLTLICTQCGTALPPQARFCFTCGAQVSAPPPQPTPAPPAAPPTSDVSPLDRAIQRLIPAEFAERLLASRGRVETERRLVTILFSDVKGSTAMSEDMDPEDWMEVMNEAFEVLITPIYRHEGTLVRLMGDAILALFGAPIAHEDDAERACRAALEIVAGARELAARLERERGIGGFNVRVGLNTGLVVVGEVGSDLRVEITAMGDAVNLAARMEQNAPPGGVLITHNTFRHIRGLFDVLPQPPLMVKGKKEPVQTYILLQARPRAFRMPTRGLEGVQTRTVGREEELHLLRQAFQRAMENGGTEALTVVGDAGVGKSRLLLEFEGWLATRPEDIVYLRSRAFPETTHAPYSLLRDLFCAHLDIHEDDPAEQVREKVISGLSSYLDPDRAALVGQLVGFDFSIVPAVANLLGSSSLASLALAYLTRYFHALTTEQRVVILLEDLHWADAPSLDFFAQMVEELPDRRLLIVSLARPTLYERRPDWPYARVDLRPLSTDHTRELLAEILQQEIPAGLEEIVVRSAEGNPFYVEELVKMLMEDGVIVPDGENWRVEMERLKTVHVPPTLAGVLQARLDSLPAAEKSLLQQAAVVGRNFWDTAVAVLGERPLEEVVHGLEAVRAREMVFRGEGSAPVGGREYLFKHAVLRDVAYETVLLKLRRVYHKRVAEWLETHAGERLSEYTVLIAEHYERAGEKGKAVEWLHRAGDAAWQACAFAEAVSFYGRALAFLSPEEGERRTRLLVRIGEALDKMGDYEPAKERLAEGLALARSLGEHLLAARALAVLGWIAYIQGDIDQARSLAQEQLDAARASGDRVVIARAMTDVVALEGDDAATLRCFEERLAVHREMGDRLGVAVCLLNMGNLAMNLGQLDTAARYYEEGRDLFEQVGNRWGFSNCVANLGCVAYERKDYAAAVHYNEQSLEMAQEMGDREGIVITSINMGYALIGMGEIESARTQLRRGIDLARKMGLLPRVLNGLVGVAWLFARAGRAERAAELLGLVQKAHPALIEGISSSIDTAMDAIRVSLSEEEVAAALELGRALEWDVVVPQVLAELGE